MASLVSNQPTDNSAGKLVPNLQRLSKQRTHKSRHILLAQPGTQSDSCVMGCMKIDTVGPGRVVVHEMKLQGVFFKWYTPKKLKYGKPSLGVSTLT